MISPNPNEARDLLVGTSGENQKTYYEAEDRILGDPTHVGYIMPQLAPGQSVLNLGCGTMKLVPPGDELYVGIDALFEPLRDRKKDNSEDLSVRAVGEKLPIRDETFDVIMSRVAIMYMDIPAFTVEAHRVLKPDGTLWLTGHKFTHVLLHLSRSIRKGNVKDIIFRTYVILNGLLFHLFGSLVRFPFNRRRIESFQTRRGLRRELTRRQFTDIQFFVDRPKPRGFFRTLRRARRLMASARLRVAFGRLMEWQHFLVIARKPLAP